MVAGGNLIKGCYPGESTTRIANLTTSKLHWNSVLSTQCAKCMCLDIKSFNLLAPLNRYEYMKIPIGLFPRWIIEKYNLLHHVHNGHIYLEMCGAV